MLIRTKHKRKHKGSDIVHLNPLKEEPREPKIGNLSPREKLRQLVARKRCYLEFLAADRVNHTYPLVRKLRRHQVVVGVTGKMES